MTSPNPPRPPASRGRRSTAPQPPPPVGPPVEPAEDSGEDSGEEQDTGQDIAADTPNIEQRGGPDSVPAYPAGQEPKPS